MIETKLTDKDVQKFISEERCPQGKHFPEYIYHWPLPEVDKYLLMGHCAICGTDYTISKDYRK